MALPWLESLPAWGTPSKPVFPKRFAGLFMGNGVNGNHWWSKGSGGEMTLGKTLQPLEPLKKKINVINGLFHNAAVGRGIHPAQTGNLLSGVPLARGTAVRGGISMDQVLARRVGQEGAIPSLVLTCEPPAAGQHESGFSMAYSSHISWADAESPVPAEVYPARAFERLFGNRVNGSVLDGVRESAAGLERQLGASDKARVDEYLTRVRELEKRTQSAGDIRDHMRLMVDIIALAFQTDRTRIASLVLARDLSGLHYPFLGEMRDHHAASHDDLSDAYEGIVRLHVTQFAELAARLDAMPEGEGTVLDNSCLLFLSNMWSGWKHDNRKLPVVTAGGLGGTLKTGRSLDYLPAGDENRKLCSLYLGIMDRMGVELDGFGDAKTRLVEL